MNNLTDVFHYGVVEQRSEDEFRLGRCKVRIIGLHTENREELPTEELPWAYIMGSPYSGSISGIGYSPVGLLEGTIVVVIFRDVYKQHPIIIGSLGGIPEKIEEYETMLVETKATMSQTDNDRILQTTDDGDSSGSTNDPQPPKKDKEEPTEEENTPAVSKPGAMTVSKKGADWMKNNEGLASLSKDKIKLGNTNTSPDQKIHAYKDSGGVWTIGWGNTFYADGSKVKEGDTITRGEADKLFDDIHQGFADKVNADLKVPVTQSMFDSLVDMSYNMGHAGLTKSAMWSSLNNGKYEEAAALIPSTRATVKGQPNKGLSNRRTKQKNKFLEDGVPSKDLSKVNPDPTRPDEDEEEDKTKNPSVRKKQRLKIENEEGEKSFVQTTEDKRRDVKSDGFRDPNKKYPLEQFLDEPDTHRLARHEKIDETIVAKKEAARVEDVKVHKNKKWSQPKIPYNALYPFNQAFVSEAGHILEYDNTRDNERIHQYHIAGTFEEIDRNGTRVNRIVGDGYEIFERHGYVLIKGTCNITVQGSSFIRVENDANLQVLGDCKTEVTGNMETSVMGDYKVKAKNIQFEAYAGDMDVKVFGTYAEDASKIYMNSGVASATGLETPSEPATGEPSFPTLEVPDRTNEYNGNYESPEEGDATKFIESMKKDGVYKPPELKPQKPEPEEPPEKAEEKKKPEKPVSCDGNPNYPVGDGPYTAGTRLNGSWTLGDVCKGRSGIPKGENYGRSAKEIVTNLQILTDNVIDPVKKMYPNMVITNTWRSEAVNSSLKGASKTSDHLKGQAVDIQFSGFNRKQTYEAAKAIQKALPDYDQMLLEYSGNSMWIHISFKCPKAGGNRRQTMTIDVLNKKNNRNGEFVLYERQ